MPLLLVAVFAVLFLSLVREDRPLREAALIGFTALWIAMLILTRGLSLFHALATPWIASTWALLLGAWGIANRERIRTGATVLRERFVHSNRDRIDWWFAGTVSVFAAGTLASALLYPIVNFDSLTCHAARVFFWLQNRSVAAYPTSFGPQLFEGPLGAYFVLNLKALALGSDRLANLVQWFSYLFSMIAVSLVAMRLGATRRGQQAAVLAAATVPMAVLQASTTQNDLNVAVWCLIAAYCAVTYIRSDLGELSIAPWAMWTGCALGLALLAKPTAYMFCFPFFVWLAFVAIRREGWLRAAALAGTVVLVALVINAPTYAQNAWLLGGGDVIGRSAPGVPQAVSRVRDPRGLLTTAIKNGSMELGTPFQAVNERIADAVEAVVRLTGGELEDPAAKESVHETYKLDNRVSNHDVAPAALTVLLIVLSCAVVLASADVTASVKLYVPCAAAGGLLVATLIAWNPYINRLLLGSLMLMVPIVGPAVTLSLKRANRWLTVVLLGVLGLSVAWAAVVMAFNSTNRLVPPSWAPVSVGQRDLGYWNTSYDDLRFRTLTPQVEGPYKAIAAAVARNGISRVGLDVRTPLGWYPIYPLLSLLPDTRFTYVRDTLFPGKLPAPVTDEQAIVEIVPAADYPEILNDGRARGQELIAPQHTPDHVILLYRAP